MTTRSRRWLLTCATALLVVATSAVPAFAGNSPGYSGPQAGATGGDKPAVEVKETQPGGGGGSGPAPTVQDCSDHDLILDGLIRGIGESGSALFGGLGDVDTTTGAQFAWRRCTLIADGSDVGFFTGLPPIPTTDILVASARSQLVLDLPDIATSPPRGGEQLVGIPIWFWVENAAPVTTTAGIPGLSATLIAEPTATQVTISGGPSEATGDRVTIDCPGAGTPWEAGRYADRASSDCSHPFDWNGTFTVDATVEWTLSWTATNGQAGTLPPVSRTTTFTLTIEEAQAVTD